MNAREQEYKEIFIAEAKEIYDNLSRLIIDLEKAPNDDKLLAEVFRMLHNLKANSKAMGYDVLGDTAHTMETAFGLIRSKEIQFKSSVVTVLVDGVDLLHELILNVGNPDFAAPGELLHHLELVVTNTSESKKELENVKRYYGAQNIALSDLIYLRIKKLDDLMNLIGELIIDKDRITSLAKDTGNDELRGVVSHLHRIAMELQYKVMDARLINIGSLFNKFPRIIRDVAIVENKQVECSIAGQDIQIDRNILQIITDSILHIVRNAVSHGIESPDVRISKGKAVIGKLKLAARNDKDCVTVDISDDGGGIDINLVRRHAVAQGHISADRAQELNPTETLSFIFEPGFSLSEKVNENSGRGVGLDVVKNALDAIGGKITIASEIDHGTTFTMSIPTSMAVKGALLFEVNGSSYAIPLIHTVYVLTVKPEEIHQISSSLALDIKTEVIPLILLKEFLYSDKGMAGSKHQLTKGKQDIIIISYNNRKVGLIVDKFLRQQDIVVKALQEPVDVIDLFDGVTVLGNGEVCLVMDVPAIIRNFINTTNTVLA